MMRRDDARLLLLLLLPRGCSVGTGAAAAAPDVGCVVRSMLALLLVRLLTQMPCRVRLLSMKVRASA